AADAASHRSGKWAFDRNSEFGDGLDRVFGEPFAEGVKGFLAGEYLEPGHASLAVKGLLDRRIEDPLRGPPDIAPNAVALNEWDYGAVRHLEPVTINGNLLTVGRNFYTIELLHGLGDLLSVSGF